MRDRRRNNPGLTDRLGVSDAPNWRVAGPLGKLFSVVFALLFALAAFGVLFGAILGAAGHPS